MRRKAPGGRPLRVRRGTAAIGARAASLERPLGLVGIVLVTVGLVERALAGPDPSVPGVAGIVALTAAAVALHPRVSRLTRFAVAAPPGAMFAVTGVLSHGLGLFTAGPHGAT